MPRAYLLVAAGAVFGATARFFFTHLSSVLSQHHGFPHGTLLVNVIGSFIAGYVLEHTPSDSWRLLLVVGFCGAFTTFSAFAWETVSYVREAKYLLAIGNILANNVLSIVFLAVGVVVARLRMG